MTDSATQSCETYEAAVDADALLGAVAGRAGALQPLGAGQVDEVELGVERLELRLGGGARRGRDAPAVRASVALRGAGLKCGRVTSMKLDGIRPTKAAVCLAHPFPAHSQRFS